MADEKTGKIKVSRGSVEDLIPDDQNANEGTERGQHMIDVSFERSGAGRSVLVDKNGKVIAGNKSQQAAADAGITDAIIVETEGDELVVVKRRDLDLDDDEDGRARALAYADNRAAQVGLHWNAAQVVADLQSGVDVSGMFFDSELADIVAEELTDADVIGVESDDGRDSAYYAKIKGATGKGGVRLLFGEIMIVLSRELYNRVVDAIQHCDDHTYTIRDVMVAILESGLDSLGELGHESSNN
jgi:hypothetical protein